MKKSVFLFVLLILLASVAWSAEVVLVVNPKNAVDSLSRQDAEDIYFGKKTTWDGGGTIAPCAQQDAAVHRLFVEQVLKKTPDQYTLFWRKAIFTGKGTPPKEVANSDAVKKLVAANPNAVGYISADALDSSVKKLSVR